eukprot:4985145-Prymnesium_polylepis.1
MMSPRLATLPLLCAAVRAAEQCADPGAGPAVFETSETSAAVRHYEDQGCKELPLRPVAIGIPSCSCTRSCKESLTFGLLLADAVVRNILDVSLLKEVSAHVDMLLARYPSVPPEHLHHVFMKNDPSRYGLKTGRSPLTQAFWIRLASDERLLALADAFAPFINGSVALFSSHYFCKMPQTGKAVLWHQDGSYWPLRPMDVITLYLAVDDADEANGAMRIVPGSQRWELAALQNSSRDGSDVLGSATHDDAELHGASSVMLALKAGDVE